MDRFRRPGPMYFTAEDVQVMRNLLDAFNEVGDDIVPSPHPHLRMPLFESRADGFV